MFRKSLFSAPTLLVLLCIVGVISFAAPRTADAQTTTVTGVTLKYQRAGETDRIDSTPDTYIKAGDYIIGEVTFSANVDVYASARLNMRIDKPQWHIGLEEQSYYGQIDMIPRNVIAAPMAFPYDWRIGVGQLYSMRRGIKVQQNVRTVIFEYLVQAKDEDLTGIELRGDADSTGGFLNASVHGQSIVNTGATTALAPNYEHGTAAERINWAGANYVALATAANANAPRVENTRPQIAGYRTKEDSRKFTSLPTKFAPSHTFTVWEHNLHAAHTEDGNRREPTAHGGYSANQIVLADSHATLRDAYFYGEGDKITAEITFDESVTVSTKAVWIIELDADLRPIVPVPAEENTKILFSYIVGSGASANNLDGDFDLVPRFLGNFPPTYWTTASDGISDRAGNLLWDGIYGTTLRLFPRTSRTGTFNEGTTVRLVLLGMRLPSLEMRTGDTA